MQACFGLPGIDEAGSTCDGCPTKSPCSKFRKLVEDAVLAETGHSDPRREYHARKNREDVQAHRARRRSLLTAT